MEGQDRKEGLRWYQTEGKSRIQKLVLNLTAKGYRELYIRSDGVCAVRAGGRFCFAGKLTGLPEHALKRIEEEMRQESGVEVQTNGNYCKLLWKEDMTDADSRGS